MSQIIFLAEIYRGHSLDLREMNDFELKRHFEVSQHEPRIFALTRTTSEFMSMRWLRGSGLEVGAGAYPIPYTVRQRFCLPIAIASCSMGPTRSISKSQSMILNFQ